MKTFKDFISKFFFQLREVPKQLFHKFKYSILICEWAILEGIIQKRNNFKTDFTCACNCFDKKTNFLHKTCKKNISKNASCSVFLRTRTLHKIQRILFIQSFVKEILFLQEARMVCFKQEISKIASNSFF